ncbi:MAG: Radical SAM superfamily protein [Candidatus Argoarchaeum ethanivorans]|uniref:Radical SAM superfamily protein n=1 Tax=Candidatus Argoarchaeum ethanivorans TaxID=2608793 RepID=A0A811T6Y5_9EURY|nr:MAG: Radical SAM superfamily protein [Candidatus Argoarchaeum ethanivorans]
MRTLLINPDSPMMRGIGGACAFPLGLGYVAAVLEEYHEVKVIDVGAEKLDDDSLSEKISKIDPEIVGITSDTLSFQRAIEIAQIVKQINKRIIVVIGGAHANALPTDPLKYDCFDISSHGEGERTAIELWDRIEKGGSYEDVKGIAFRKNNEIVINPRQELIENLDGLPFPARHLFPMDKYSGEFCLYVSPMYSVGTSRGCPFSCAFCSNNVIFGRKYRSRSPKNIVNEIELLINEYGAKGIYFREDIFTMNKKRVIEICNEIKERKLEFKWVCESRVNTINEEMLRSMKNAGCELIWFGVESGSQKILDRIHKQITITQSRDAFRLCKKIKLKAGASFLIGTPGEKIEDIYKTINFANELKPEFAWFNIFTGYPTSPLYEYVVKNRLYEKNIGHGILIIKTNEFNREKLEKIQRYADRKVNGNMKKLFKLFLSEIRQGNFTRERMVNGIKYIKHYYFDGK